MERPLPSPDVLATPGPGELLAERYRLVRHIGEGGMATVWEAIDTANGVTVAVKILGRLDEISRRRFFREGQLMSEVDHANVVRVDGVFSLPHDGALMAMERLHGESLADRLWSRARLSSTETMHVGIALLDALTSIHAQGIVHRDLKPENVFITDDGGIKLLDFGIATATSGSLKLTRTGALVGTPVYMAPEQILEEDTMGAPLDLWALGIVLYECITGRSPTDRDNLGQVFQAILVGGYPAPHLLEPSCPRPLSELVLALLCRAPEVRPTAREARRKLAAMRDGAPVEIARAEPLRRSHDTGSSAHRRGGFCASLSPHADLDSRRHRWPGRMGCVPHHRASSAPHRAAADGE